MENASKALLITAGVMLAIMLLSVIFIFGNQMASYFSEKHDAKMIEQLVEFNNKFQNYNGEVIRGNELVSIMNRIVDYNDYQSDMVGYEPIKISIDFFDKKYIKELKYKNETVTQGNGLLPDNSSSIKNYTNEADTTVNDTLIRNIATTSNRLIRDYGTNNPNDTTKIYGLTDTKLQKMSARISEIVEDDTAIVTTPEGKQHQQEYLAYREQLLGRILGAGNVHVDKTQWVKNTKKVTYQYYQYTMFKRAVFKCTNVSYNETNGRVNKIDFAVEFEDNNGVKKVKID